MNKNKIIVGSIIGGIVIGVAMIYFYKKSKQGSNIKSILFIGDSNTTSNFSYADQIKKSFPDINIKKIAKVGEKTDWMKSQLDNELKKK